MAISLPLNKMSAEEKIEVMESIWTDLVETAGSTLSPEWHKSVLKERELAALSGEDAVLDWDIAKRKILKDLQ